METFIQKQLIEKCKKGDTRSQFQLYRKYSKAMFNICMRMVNSRQDAEDILQEAFSDAFLHLDSFRYESTFGAWLKRIVINKSINMLKKKNPCLSLNDELITYENATTENNYENEYPALDIEMIQKALKKLPDGYRVVFSLYLLEGYNHEEISRILNIKKSTSRSQYLRAKQKIKWILTQQYMAESKCRQMEMTN